MRYDPIMCMMVDDSVKTHDELSLSQKKQVVTELKGFLKKSYNFSDESEYARAYEDLRYMFTTGSRKSISGLFENAVKKTGAHDSVKTKDANKNEGYKIHKAEIRGDKLYLTYTDLLYGGKETESFTKSEAKGFLTDPWNTWEGNTKSVMMKFVKDSKTIDKAIRSCDRVTVKYDDAIGDTHTFFKETEEEAKKWIDQGKFPHGAAFNVKIDGKLYKKEAR